MLEHQSSERAYTGKQAGERAFRCYKKTEGKARNPCVSKRGLEREGCSDVAKNLKKREYKSAQKEPEPWKL